MSSNKSEGRASEPSAKSRRRRILIAAHREQSDVTPLLEELLPSLKSAGFDVIPAQDLGVSFKDEKLGAIEVTDTSVERPGQPVPGVDLVLALGGDGFMMALIRALDYPSTSFYGINYGRVGFLMNPRLTAEELTRVLVDEAWSKCSYPVLEARITLSDGREVVERAFNDFVIERASGQTVELNCYIDDVLLNRYSGDGLIVATPGGSTAYSLAAGGPVVHHSVDSMVVTPLCPHRPIQFHSLQFPLVLTLRSAIRVVNSDRQKRPCRCVCDGRAVEHISEVSIRHRGLRVTLLRGAGYDFVDTLVKKVIGRSNGSSDD
ncbi:MAG: NAD(+)/NADH kinase [Planctomycetes bacterium]|nr:NAD(+)/NADH kinase [Planctomycetota bacterium]